MPEENGKKLQDLAIQGISMAVIAVLAGGGGGYLAPDAPDPNVAVLQEQNRHMRAELIVAEAKISRLEMEVGEVRGTMHMIGKIL